MSKALSDVRVIDLGHVLAAPTAAMTEPICVAYNAVAEKSRINPGDVVAIIHQRRGKGRQQPDTVNAEVLQIIQLGDLTLDILCRKQQ